MCLTIKKITGCLKTRGIRRTKDKKFLIGYKALDPLPGSPSKEYPFGLVSVHQGYLWGNARRENGTFVIDPESKELQFSGRKSVVLDSSEIKYSQVYEGFHFWTHKEEAEARAGVVVECHIPIESFVAKGDFCGKSFVATHAKLHKVVSSRFF